LNPPDASQPGRSVRRIRLLTLSQAESEMQRIGCHPEGISIMAPKAVFRVLKIEGLSPFQANVLKQEMLSHGADAATAAGCIDCTCKKSDVLLFGTVSQLRQVCEKLKQQPASFQPIAREILRILEKKAVPRQWKIRDRTLKLGERTLIMGILNVTPDSFSDGGRYFEPLDAVDHALRLEQEGADILDIGGESTRPGSDPVSEEEEKRRVLPILEALQGKTRLPVSIDTCKSGVAREALERGACIVNDVTALKGDPEMPGVCSQYGAGVVLMHMLGRPKTMQKNPKYKDVVEEVAAFLQERVRDAEGAGISGDSILVDPGIGFGKILEHNLALIRAIPYLEEETGKPVLMGISRKRFIGELTGAPVGERLPGTLAAAVACALHRAAVVRVHDVKASRAAIRVAEALREPHS